MWSRRKLNAYDTCNTWKIIISASRRAIVEWAKATGENAISFSASLWAAAESWTIQRRAARSLWVCVRTNAVSFIVLARKIAIRKIIFRSCVQARKRRALVCGLCNTWMRSNQCITAMGTWKRQSDGVVLVTYSKIMNFSGFVYCFNIN